MTAAEQKAVLGDLTRDAIGYMLNCSGRQVTLLKVPRNQHDRYDAQAVVEWVRGQGPGRDKAIDDKRRVETELRQLELSEKRGELVKRDSVREGMAAMAVVLREMCEQLQRLPTDGEEAHRIANDAIDRFKRMNNSRAGWTKASSNGKAKS